MISGQGSGVVFGEGEREVRGLRIVKAVRALRFLSPIEFQGP